MLSLEEATVFSGPIAVAFECLSVYHWQSPTVTHECIHNQVCERDCVAAGFLLCIVVCGCPALKVPACSLTVLRVVTGSFMCGRLPCKLQLA